MNAKSITTEPRQILNLKPSDIIADLTLRGRAKAPDAKAVKELADSLKAHGQLEPITVRDIDVDGKPTYQVVFGYTRLEAAKLAKMPYIEAIVTDADSEANLVQNIVENLDRNATTPLDDAFNQKALRESLNWTDKQIGELYHQSAAWVGRLKYLLDLSPKVQKFINAGVLSASGALALVGVDEAKALKIIEQSLTTVKAKPTVKDAKETAKQGKKAPAKPATKKVAKTAKIKKGVRAEKVAKAATKKATGDKTKEKGNTKEGMSLAEVKQYFTDLTGPGEHQTVAAFAKAMVEVISGKAIEDKATNALNKIWQVYESKAAG